jgi:hypothetical protein
MTTRISGNQGHLSSAADLAASMGADSPSYKAISDAGNSLTSSLVDINKKIAAAMAKLSSNGEVDPKAYQELTALNHSREMIQKGLELLSGVLSSMRQTFSAIIQNIR